MTDNTQEFGPWINRTGETACPVPLGYIIEVEIFCGCHSEFTVNEHEPWVWDAAQKEGHTCFQCHKDAEVGKMLIPWYRVKRPEALRQMAKEAATITTNQTKQKENAHE